MPNAPFTHQYFVPASTNKSLTAMSEDTIRAFAGRLTLHKEPDVIKEGVVVKEGRKEEMYYYMCFDWDRLRDLLRDPLVFFRDTVGLESDTLVSPVVAIIKPTSKSMMYLSGTVLKKRELDQKSAQVFDFATTFMKVEPDKVRAILGDDVVTMGTDSVDANKLIDFKDGWFFAEFANRTHVLTIYYKRPSREVLAASLAQGKEKRQYSQAYTDPTICTTGSSNYGQAHYDLHIDDTDNFEQHTADYIVDLLEDGGRRTCHALNKRGREKGDFTEIFDQNGSRLPTVVPVKQTTPDKRRFSTEYMRGRGHGINLIVEGLSTTEKGIAQVPTMKDGKMELFGTPTFVCSQSYFYLHNNDEITMEDQILKRYLAPPSDPDQ